MARRERLPMAPTEAQRTKGTMEADMRKRTLVPELYRVRFPRTAVAVPELRPEAPKTIAPPISGEVVLTADNRPEDPASWQNEPGPGAGESAAAEVVRRDNTPMEIVERISVPGNFGKAA
jgi:hypothetical protein